MYNNDVASRELLFYDCQTTSIVLECDIFLFSIVYMGIGGEQLVSNDKGLDKAPNRDQRFEQIVRSVYKELHADRETGC